MDIQRLRPASDKLPVGTARLGNYVKTLLARYHLSLPGLLTLLIILLATILRVVLLQRGWPALDSDEATVGLMALHILKQGEHPLVLYGQDYMGSLTAYLAACFFVLFGPGVLALRLSMVLLFALFLVSTYLLISLLYFRRAALLTLCVLGLGTPELFFRELEASGGSGELLVFGSLVLLLASWLALTSRQGSHVAPVRWRRALAYIAWSLLAGLGLWSNPWVLPFVLTSGMLLWLFCRSEVSMALVALLAFGFLLGFSPQLLYKATEMQQPPVSLFSDSLAQGTQNRTTGMSASLVEPLHPASLLGQFIGSVMVSVPAITGGDALCPIEAKNAELPLDQMDEQTLHCAYVHGFWGLGYLTLLLVALLAAYRLYWRRWLQSIRPFAHALSGKLWLRAPAPAQPLEARQQTIRQVARMAILLGGGLTWLCYMLFPQAQLSPLSSSRYLVGLLLSYPALLAFLFELTRALSSRHWPQFWQAVMGYLLISLVAATFLIGVFNVFDQMPQVASQDVQQLSLVHDLRKLHAQYIYTDYKTCDRVAFQSLEGIRCSVLQDQLYPGLNRYQPYADQVNQFTHSFYVFPLHSILDDNFGQLLVRDAMPYRRVAKDGYAIYLPESYTTSG